MHQDRTTLERWTPFLRVAGLVVLAVALAPNGFT